MFSRMLCISQTGQETRLPILVGSNAKLELAADRRLKTNSVDGTQSKDLEVIPGHSLGDACRFFLAFYLDSDFLDYLEALLVNLVHAGQLATSSYF